MHDHEADDSEVTVLREQLSFDENDQAYIPDFDDCEVLDKQYSQG